MSWKPAALGAVLVGLAGLGVGVAIGGKEIERTRTVVRTVREGTTTPESEAPDAEQTAPSDTEPTAPPEDGPPDELFLVDSRKPVVSNAAAKDGSAKIGRTTYPSSVRVSLFDDYDQDAPSTFEVPVEQGITLRGTLGFTPETPSDAKADLEIHRDWARGPVLYRKSFEYSSVIARIDLKLQDANKVVFVWRTKSSGSYEFPTDEAVFVLGDARFSG